MPQAAAAWTASALIAATGHAVWTSSIAYTAIYAASYVGYSLALSAGISALSQKDQRDNAGQLLDTNVASDAPRQIIIGERETGGSLVGRYVHNPQNNHLVEVIALADHRCEGCLTYYADGVEYLTNLAHGVRTEVDNYRGESDRLFVTWYDGRHDQAVDAYLRDLVLTNQPDWTANHRGRGVSYLIVEMVWDDDVMLSPVSSTVKLRGGRWYDRREDDTAGGVGDQRLADPDSWTYTNNPDVFADHYQLGIVPYPDAPILSWGLGLKPWQLPYDLFKEEADISDEEVLKKDGETTQQRYALNAIFSGTLTHREILGRVARAKAARIVDRGGRIAIIGPQARTPVMTLYDSDLVVGEQSIYSDKLSTSELFNVFRGTFPDASQRFQPVEYPKLTDEDWLEADGGDELQEDVDIDVDTDSERVQRLVWLHAMDRRRQARLSESYMPPAFEIEDGDWFERVGARFPDGKLFEAIRVSHMIDPEKGMFAVITSKEVDPDDVAWNEDMAADLSAPPVPNQEVEFAVFEAPDLDAIPSTITGAGSTRPALLVSWDNATDTRIRSILLEVVKSTGGPVTQITVDAGPNAENEVKLDLAVAENVTYLIRGRYQGATIKPSAWSSNVPATTGATYTVPVATSASTIADDSVTIAKFADGITPVEILAALPSSGNFEGRTVFLTTNGKLYRYTSGAFTTVVPTTDLTGQITASQITDGAVTIAKFGAGLTPVEVLGALPSSGNFDGRQVYLTSDKKLYRYNSTAGAFQASVATTDLTGQITAAQFAGLVGGDNLLSNSSLEQVDGLNLPRGYGEYNNAAISTTLSQVTGYDGGYAFSLKANASTSNVLGILTNSGITSGGVTGGVRGGWKASTSYVVSFRAKKVNGAGFTNMVLAWNTAPSVTTTLNNPNVTTSWQRYAFRILWGGSVENNGGLHLFVAGSKIANDEIHIDQLQVVEGDADVIYSPRADEILPSTITTTEIADNGITAPKIAAGAVVAGKIAANAVTATEIAAGSITTAKIAALAVTAAELAANAVTAGKIAANAVTAGTIAAGVVTATEIAAGAVTTAKLLIGASGAALNVDPGFNDTSAWSHFNGAAGTITTITDGKTGGGVLRNGTGNSSGSWYAENKQIPLDANKTYRFRMWVRQISGSNSKVYFGGAVYDYSGNYYGGAYAVNFVTVNTSTWTEVVGTITGAAMKTATNALGTLFRPVVIAGYDSTSNLGVHEIQDARVEEVLPSTLIADGAIITAKIAAGAVTATEISAGAITTAKLAAGAVTSNELAANSVIAGKIAAAAVSTTELAADAVKASKLFIQPEGSALNADPAFSDSTAWVDIGGTVSVFATVSDGKVGNTVVRSNAAMQSGVGGVRQVPIDPAKTYRVRAWVRQISGSGSNLYVGYRIQQSNGANIAGPGGTYWYRAASALAVTSTWTEVVGLFGAGQGSYEFPSNARTMSPICLLGYGGGTSIHEIQDLRIEEVLPSTLIQDGAIITDKIAANAITAAKIAANVISADKLQVGFLGGGNLWKNTSFDHSAGYMSGWFGYDNDSVASFSSVSGRSAGANAVRVTFASNASSKGIYGGSSNGVVNTSIAQTGRYYVVSWYAKASSTAVGKTMQMAFNNAPSVNTALLNPALTTSWQRYAFRLYWSGTPDANIYITIQYGVAAAGTLDITEVQLEEAETPSAYGRGLQPGGVSAVLIQDGQITASKISVTSLSAISANLGSITAGTLALSAGGYVVYEGAGFGASSDLVLWFGPSSTAMGSATKTNGKFALATDGKVYFGTAELTSGAPTAVASNSTPYGYAATGNPATTASVTISTTGFTSPTITWAPYVGNETGATEEDFIISDASGFTVSWSTNGNIRSDLGPEYAFSFIAVVRDSTGKSATVIVTPFFDNTSI